MSKKTLLLSGFVNLNIKLIGFKTDKAFVED